MARSWPSQADGAFPDDEATAYALSVRSGETIAGPHVRDACARHLHDLLEGPPRGLLWSVEHVEHTLAFFRRVLKLAGGEFEGRPFDPLPWQAFIIGSLFGWLRADDHLRRFRTAYIEAAKGSGKSPMLAGIGLKGLMADDEPRAEVYAAASKRDQAMILFRDAVAMVDQSPMLSSRIKKSGRSPVWNLAHHESGSFFRPIASDSSQSGPRPHVALVDELHEHPDGEVVDMMRAGTKGRRQALIVEITNSGYDRTSTCYQHHEYAIKVAAGELDDDAFFGFVSAVDEDDDPLTEEPDEALGYPPSWAKANPSLQVEEHRRTIQPRYLEELVREAKAMPGKESVVRRLNFCQWVDAESPWISGEAWRSVERDSIEWDPADPCYLALDLSSKRDLTALSIVWPSDGDLPWRARVVFWTPGETMGDRERRDRVPYKAWERKGYLQTTPGKSVDYGHVAEYVAGMLDQYNVQALAFDPWRIDELEREFDRLGLYHHRYDGEDTDPGDGLMMVRHGQGFGGGASDKQVWMPASITALEDHILAGTLAVEFNPVLRWNAASVVTTSDAQENRKFEKRKSTGRIDGVVALAMAVGCADKLRDERVGDSITERMGVAWI